MSTTDIITDDTTKPRKTSSFLEMTERFNRTKVFRGESSVVLPKKSTLALIVTNDNVNATYAHHPKQDDGKLDKVINDHIDKTLQSPLYLVSPVKLNSSVTPLVDKSSSLFPDFHFKIKNNNQSLPSVIRINCYIPIGEGGREKGDGDWDVNGFNDKSDEDESTPSSSNSLILRNTKQSLPSITITNSNSNTIKSLCEIGEDSKRSSAHKYKNKYVEGGDNYSSSRSQAQLKLRSIKHTKTKTKNKQHLPSPNRYQSHQTSLSSFDFETKIAHNLIQEVRSKYNVSAVRTLYKRRVQEDENVVRDKHNMKIKLKKAEGFVCKRRNNYLGDGDRQILENTIPKPDDNQTTEIKPKQSTIKDVTLKTLSTDASYKVTLEAKIRECLRDGKTCLLRSSLIGVDPIDNNKNNKIAKEDQKNEARIALQTLSTPFLRSLDGGVIPNVYETDFHPDIGMSGGGGGRVLECVLVPKLKRA